MFPMFAFSMPGEMLALYILSAIVALGVSYVGVQKLVSVDREVIARRKAAGHLAGTLQKFGLKKIPAFLIDYSAGDYVSMAESIHDLAKDALKGEDSVVAELKDVASNVLDAMLKTEAGRALVAAKLADAAKPSDSSTVNEAPKAVAQPSKS